MTQSLRRDTFILFSQKKKINNNRTLSKVYVSGIQDVDSNRLMSKPNTHTHTHTPGTKKNRLTFTECRRVMVTRSYHRYTVT